MGTLETHMEKKTVNSGVSSGSESFSLAGRAQKIGPYLGIPLPPERFGHARVCKVMYEVRGLSGRGFVRRLRSGLNVLMIEAEKAAELDLREDEKVEVLLQIVPDRSSAKLPFDVDHRLEQEGLDIDDMDEADRRHLVTMMQESNTPEIRARRLNYFLQSLKSRLRSGGDTTAVHVKRF